jgi:hypothetical protein
MKTSLRTPEIERAAITQRLERRFVETAEGLRMKWVLVDAQSGDQEMQGIDKETQATQRAEAVRGARVHTAPFGGFPKIAHPNCSG